MRLLTRIGLALAVILSLVAPAPAQIAPGPGFVIKASRSSVTISNATPAPLFTYDIPAGFAVPLHLRLEGTLSTNAAASPANLACNYGGANASLTLLNATTMVSPFPLSATNIPIAIDFRVRPIPTWDTSTPVGVAVFGVVTSSATSTTVASSSVVTSALTPLNGTSQGLVNMLSASGQTISCQWTWGAGGGVSAERIITIWQGNLFVGE